MNLPPRGLDRGDLIAACDPLPAAGGNSANGVESVRGFAATAHAMATDAASTMLRNGGNAVDAAVAAAWALAVCEPGNSGLGGQSIILMGLASPGEGIDRITVLDGHSRAPAAASLKTIDRQQQRSGYRATTVPTTPRLLETARQHYGRLSLPQVLEPAIRLAEDGFPVSALHRRQLGWCLKGLRSSDSARRLFLHHDHPYEVGQIFRQPNLAATLRRLAHFGVDDFYVGQVARQIADDMQLHGGLLTLQDLASTGPPVERATESTIYRGCTVISTPPPSGGSQVLSGLDLLELRDLSGGNLGDWYEALGETTHAVFHDRENGKLALRDGHSTGGATWSLAEGPGETTHLCTADSEGNVVSLTQSIQSLFGARVACEPGGFLYNNYLTTCPRERHPRQLSSGCQPRSNSAPTFVFLARRSAEEAAEMPIGRARESVRAHAVRSVRPMLALGAAGSRRTTSAILHTISGVVDRGLTLADAVAVPRFHVKLSRRSWLERSPETELLVSRLSNCFREVQLRSRLSYAMGCAQAVEIHEDGTITGTADPRREGTAASA